MLKMNVFPLMLRMTYKSREEFRKSLNKAASQKHVDQFLRSVLITLLIKKANIKNNVLIVYLTHLRKIILLFDVLTVQIGNWAFFLCKR